MNPKLAAIGDALERAVAVELEHARPRRRRAWRSRRAGVAVIAVAIAVPAVAYAASNLFSPNQVAASLPQGTRALIGTDPTCRVITANVEYRCVLASPPSDSGAPGSTAPDGRQTAVVTTANGRRYYVLAKSMLALKRQVASIRGVRRVKLLGPPGAAPAATNWNGTVEPTVDATKHVDGGCRSRNAAGTIWECYIGEAAVKQSIISQGFLGAYAPSPGVG
ncbi:MAG TPA: hypothetical protein VFH80_17760 [Solirubrobacteraceae bacterium]|nr:hypothetical protein [Solirubrobacteraceae bacterium]